MPFKGTRPKCIGCGGALIMAHDYNSHNHNGEWFTRTKDPSVRIGQQYVCKDGKPHRTKGA